MPVEAASWHTEYQYRKLFGLTHHQYMDEPQEAIDWMLRISDLYARLEQKQTKAASS